jgi:hypothetical protein
VGFHDAREFGFCVGEEQQLGRGLRQSKPSPRAIVTKKAKENVAAVGMHIVILPSLPLPPTSRACGAMQDNAAPGGAGKVSNIDSHLYD